MARAKKVRSAPLPAATLVRERARALCTRFCEQGFVLAEPSILQPAELFLGLSGEDIRRRLYMVADPSGAEMCLRPDFTIPVARAYLDAAAPAEARYCYAGPAFRARRDGAGGDGRSEFYQAGIEIFGARDGEAAEIEVLRRALTGVIGEGLARFDLRLGDPGLFARLIACLDLPDAWARRLRRHFWRHDLAEDLASALSAREGGNGGSEALARALAGLDRRAAAELVEEVLALAGIVPVGGRTAEEIAQRFMERAAGTPAALSERAVRVVRAFLEIEGAPRAALAGIRRLVKAERLDLGAHVDGLERRIDAIEALLADIGARRNPVVFEAEFGRRLEYYTGLVFELRDPARPELAQVAGGGRYDQLLVDLGARRAVPAVGCAIYVDRLPAAGGRP